MNIDYVILLIILTITLIHNYSLIIILKTISKDLEKLEEKLNKTSDDNS